MLRVIEEAARKKGIELKGARVVIQGFGNAGSYLAKFMHDAGAKVIAVSDVYGAIHDPNGLDIDYLLDRRDSFGTISKLFNNTITNKELFELDCDILVPRRFRTKLRKEMPMILRRRSLWKQRMDQPLWKQRKFWMIAAFSLVPDILSNAGGVTVSYFEWVQNNQGYYWAEEEVEQKLKKIMLDSFENVYQVAQSHKVDMRLAAYMVGIRKLAEASSFRGWV